jgi:hypothetical protein
MTLFDWLACKVYACLSFRSTCVSCIFSTLVSLNKSELVLQGGKSCHHLARFLYVFALYLCISMHPLCMLLVCVGVGLSCWGGINSARYVEASTLISINSLHGCMVFSLVLHGCRHAVLLPYFRVLVLGATLYATCINILNIYRWPVWSYVLVRWAF